MADYDLIIIGAGPAGLSAALTASYMKLKHIVLEANLAGGALIEAYPWKKVDSYLGYCDKNGLEISDIMKKHVELEGSIINEKEAVEIITKKNEIFIVHTKKGEYKSKSIIITAGIAGTPRHLGIQGEDSSRVHYSIKNPVLYEGQKVLVVGGGDSAVEGAVALSKAGADVSLAHRRDEFRCTEKNRSMLSENDVKLLLNTETKEINLGKNKNTIESVIIFNNKSGKESKASYDELFFFLGSVIDIKYLVSLGLKMDGNKIVVDDSMRTSVEGAFAAGDITGRLLRIPEAIGEGHMAVYSAFKYLRNPYWAKK